MRRSAARVRAICAALIVFVFGQAHAIAADSRASAVAVADAEQPRTGLQGSAPVGAVVEQPSTRHGQAALTVGVPVTKTDFLYGELTVDFRYGYKVWWLVPYLSGGFRQSRLDQLGWPWESRNRKLRAWHATLGLRVELPASRQLFPFFGMAAERAYWAYTEDSTVYCHESYYPDEWRCYRAMDWKQGYGLKPQFGLLYKPEPSLALEFWVEYVHVMAPQMFTRSHGFFNPAVGLAWHH